ncbi:MAG: WG repeat-containing protein [Melioribacteraceae bacterium]
MKSKCSIIKGDSIGGSSVIYRKNDLFIQKGLLLNSGKEIWFNNVEFENFECNLAVYDTGSKYGYIDRLGNIVIEPKYAAGTSMKRIIDPDFEDTAYYKDGIFFVKINGLWGGVDSQDRVIFNFEYESIGTFEKGLLPVMKGNKWGIVDIIGDFNIECRFDYSPDYHEGILTYIEGNKIGVMNRRFEELKSDAIFSQASMLN